MQTWKLTLEYEGTRYSGWQEQANARTVQGELRKAATDFLNRDLEIGGAGRTDAGVHALAQVAHVKIRRRPGNAKITARPKDIMYGINDRLPADINVLKVEEADPAFHARHSAIARIYLYQISTRRTAFGKRFVWWVRDELDTSAMRDAVRLFKGKHDFAAFSERDPAREQSTLVMINSSELTMEEHLISFRITASHFLWRMVRRLAGSVVEVGRGSAAPEDIRLLLEQPKAKSKLNPARTTAPPSGLFLERIAYGSSDVR
jgi:tRNA pseudouridine38-40 synthase